MAFSQTAEYALRAMVDLARHETVVSAEALSQRTQVPKPYLAKLLTQLSRAGLVSPVRGQNGGWRISPHGRDATIYDVLQAVDPLTRIRCCPLGLAEHRDHLCPLHAGVDAAFEAMEKSFRAMRLLDIALHDSDPVETVNRAAPVKVCRKKK